MNAYLPPLRRLLPVLTCLCTALAAVAAPEPKRSLLPLLDAATINARCDGELAQARDLVARMAQGTMPGGTLAGFNQLARAADGFASAVYLMANVAVDKATRDAGEVCVAKFTPLRTEIFQNADLYRQVRDFKPKDSIDTRYRADLIESFEDTGASLPPAKRARAKAIEDELSVLGLAFQKAVNEDDTTVVLPVEAAAGMPESWLQARTRDAQGRLVLRMDYPTYAPFMQNATSEAARREVWLAFQNKGGQANLERLDRALRLRNELAALHGLPDYASFTLRRRMAANPQAVSDFLKRVKDAVVVSEKREIDELRTEKAALLGKPAEQVTVQRWDVSFLQERLKRARYAVDQEKLRAYFPTDKSVQFAMRTAEKLYGIEFAEARVPVWHADVRYFDVFDRGSDGQRGAFVGSIYLDLFPREGKYGHAAAFGVVPASRLARQKPASVLVTNFNREGLDHDELETLLHEFGHVLHGVLSTARYADQAGTAVKRDFVEAPSQMFEEWARRPETLAVFAEVCPQCPRLNAEQLAQLDRARTFGRGIRYSRQWEYASFDMRLHTGAPKQAMATWIDIEKSMPLGYVEGTLFPAGFAHLMGGYAAGYYGYMWSEVMALDMLSAFKGRLLDPAIGRRYRQTILSRGGEVPPQQMVEDFLGRKPNAEAFFAEVTGKR